MSKQAKSIISALFIGILFLIYFSIRNWFSPQFTPDSSIPDTPTSILASETSSPLPATIEYPTTTITPTLSPTVVLGSFQENATPMKFTQTPALPTPYPEITNEAGDNLIVTWGNYPGPETWPSIQIPPPIEVQGPLPDIENQISILLLGNDHRPSMGTRTDTIMILILNLDQKTAKIISIPRDLYVYAPGKTMLKINTVQPRGGYDLLYQTLQYNFGIYPDYYVNISRDAIIEVINILEGIYLYVPRALDDPVFANGDYSVDVGWTTMDGATARWYVSSRVTTDDFDRNLRQQVVLEAIFNKLMTLDAVSHVPEFYKLFQDHIKTNMTINDLVQLIPIALEIDSFGVIDRYAIQEKDVQSSYTPISHAFIFLPKPENIYSIMNTVLTP